jgi:histone H3/H4
MSELVYPTSVKKYAKEKYPGMVSEDASELVTQLAEEFIDQLLDASEEYKDSADRVVLYEEDVRKASKHVGP